MQKNSLQLVTSSLFDMGPCSRCKITQGIITRRCEACQAKEKDELAKSLTLTEFLEVYLTEWHGQLADK